MRLDPGFRRGDLWGVSMAPASSIRDIPTEVVLGPADGMPRECAANLDHVQTVAQSRIGGLVPTLDRRRMSEVRSALLFSLGF